VFASPKHEFRPYRKLPICASKMMSLSPVSEVELRKEQRRIYRGVGFAAAVCAMVFIAVHLYLPSIVEIDIDSLEEKLAFWAYSNIFIIGWVLVGIHLVSHGRRTSGADIRGAAYSAPSPKIAVFVAFLQNTVEQSFVIVFVLLALTLTLGSKACAFTVASVVLFAVGRIAFLRGYPGGAGARSFGMALTALPAIAGLAILLGVVVKGVFNG
jgi:hypothetical protein